MIEKKKNWEKDLDHYLLRQKRAKDIYGVLCLIFVEAFPSFSLFSIIQLFKNAFQNITKKHDFFFSQIQNRCDFHYKNFTLIMHHYYSMQNNGPPKIPTS